MAFYICDISALRYWTIARLDTSTDAFLDDVLGHPLAEASRYARVTTLRSNKPSANQIDQLLKTELRGLSMPLHLLVPSADERRPSSTAVFHVWSGPVPLRAFVHVAPNVYMASPAFCFLQPAPRLDMIDLITLGYELCGVYLPSSFETSGVRRCPPLVRPEELARFADAAPRVKGKRLAAQAARHVLYGAASPPECKLAMRFSLPRTMGGHGLPRPQMNRRIGMGKAVQSAWDADACFCDLFWPDHLLAVEYDSDACHTGSAKRGRDAMRRNRLSTAGITTITVTSDHLKDFNQMNTIAQQIGRHMHRRPRRGEVPARWPGKAAALHKRLVEPDSMVTPRLVSCE